MPRPIHLYLLKTKEQRATAMEKISKLKGPRGNEMMKPVLQQNNRKRGGGGGGGGAGNDLKRQRKVRETLFGDVFSLVTLFWVARGGRGGKGVCEEF